LTSYYNLGNSKYPLALGGERYCIDTTALSHGTRVVVNFANVALEAPGAGLLPPERWRVF
jgi:hypothetical protein